MFVFWGLDGYFLWQERLFRALYDHVRVLAEDQVDFSMDVSSFKTGRARTWPGAMFSRTRAMIARCTAEGCDWR